MDFENFKDVMVVAEYKAGKVLGIKWFPSNK